MIFGPEFTPAGTPLNIILAGQIASAAFGPNTPLLNMTHHERQVTKAMAIALVANVIALAMLTPSWGPSGAAAAFALSLLTWNLITWADARRLLGIDTSILPFSWNRMN
jgi:O-antigen/teichoic acid export membrane protein